MKEFTDRLVRNRYSLEIIAIAAILTSFGILLVYSSSSIQAYQNLHDPYHFVRKQILIAAVGFSAVFSLQYIPMKWIQRATLPLFALSLMLLCFTLLPGFQHKAKGATRWINLGIFNFQPAELAKLALVLFMAKNLARPSANTKKPAFLASTVAFFGLLALPLMLQPDFGSTFLLFAIVYIMLFSARMPLAYTAWGVVVAILAVVLAILQAPYRLARLVSFLDPWADLHRGGFQIIQSYLGFQNGGLLGQGVGESQQKLYFLPEAHTDFIISVIGEEFGLIGVLFVILCFVLMFHAGFKIAMGQKQVYQRFLGLGLTSLIGMQASINLGVALGMLPTKGISLPFVSSGASSLLVFLIIVGLLSRLEKGT